MLTSYHTLSAFSKVEKDARDLNFSLDYGKKDIGRGSGKQSCRRKNKALLHLGLMISNSK